VRTCIGGYFSALRGKNPRLDSAWLSNASSLRSQSERSSAISYARVGGQIALTPCVTVEFRESS